MRVFVPKKWGYEDWIVNNDKYCGKLLFFKKAHSCSYHYHLIKHETFYVHSGKILLEFGSSNFIEHATKIILESGDTFTVNVGLRHRMTGLLDTELFEFSTTHYDEDSYRIIPS